MRHQHSIRIMVADGRWPTAVLCQRLDLCLNVHCARDSNVMFNITKEEKRE